MTFCCTRRVQQRRVTWNMGWPNCPHTYGESLKVKFGNHLLHHIISESHKHVNSLMLKLCQPLAFFLLSVCPHQMRESHMHGPQLIITFEAHPNESLSRFSRCRLNRVVWCNSLCSRDLPNLESFFHPSLSQEACWRRLDMASAQWRHVPELPVESLLSGSDKAQANT